MKHENQPIEYITFIRTLNKYYYREIPERNAYLYVNRYFKSVKNLTQENIELFCYLKNNCKASKPEHLAFVECVYQYSKNFRYEYRLTKNEILHYITNDLKFEKISKRSIYKVFDNIQPVNNLYTYNDLYVIVLRALRIRDRCPYGKRKTLFN